MKSALSILLLPLFLQIFFSGDLNAQLLAENSDSIEAAELYSRAVYLFGEKKFNESAELGTECLQLIFGEDENNRKLPVLALIGESYSRLGKDAEAIPYMLRVFNIYEEGKDTTGLVNTAEDIAEAYFRLKAFEKAGVYYKTALDLVAQSVKPMRALYLEDLGFCSLYSGNPDSAVVCFSQMRKELVDAGKDDTKALYFLVKSCNEAGRYEEALGYNNSLFDRYSKNPDYPKMSGLKNNSAWNLTLLHRYSEAAACYADALKYGEMAGNSPGDQATLMTNRAVCLQNNGQWKPAVNVFRDAIAKYDEAGDLRGKARVEEMVSQVYFSRGDLYNAGLFSKNSVESARQAKDPVQLAGSCLTYSKMLREGNDPIAALEYYEEYLRIRDSLQFETRIKEEKLAALKFDLEKSEKELNLKVREEQVKKLNIRQLTLQLEKEEKEKALMMREKEVDKLEREGLRQSMEISNQRHAAEQNAREKQILEQVNRIKDLQIEKDSARQKELNQEISLLETQKERDKLLIEKQKAARQAMTLIIILTVLAALSILANLITTRRKNMLLARQKKEIQEQNLDLEQKNDEISAQRDEIESQRDLVFAQKEEIELIHSEMTKSIEYARKIQTSIIPKPEALAGIIPGSFVFFRPRDIVSGDFYWFATVENTTVVAVADCTGHGVPGAIMSMLGMSLLKEIVLKEYITQPAVILRRLRKEIINALGQKGISGEQRDGMDMALVSIHNDTHLLEFAGAFNPMYLVRDNKKSAPGDDIEVAAEDNLNRLYLVQADKMPVAHYDRMDKFTNYEFAFFPGDRLYLFTDGFADQFGGPGGKKFMYKPFMNLLLQSAGHPMEKQGELLSATFMEWKGELDQVDDVCVLGLKI